MMSLYTGTWMVASRNLCDIGVRGDMGTQMGTWGQMVASRSLRDIDVCGDTGTWTLRWWLHGAFKMSVCAWRRGDFMETS